MPPPRLAALGLAVLLTPVLRATPAETASAALVRRTLPAHASEIDVRQIPPGPGGEDVFEVRTQAGRLVLSGNTGVAIASGLGWYLEHVAHLQLSWDGDNLALPGPLPRVPAPVRITSPYRYRAYLNYCTFSYTMAWWDRARWEREIDWMALHGVNLPLATTGQEAVWQACLRRFGMSDAEIRAYLAGPAFSAWQWLTNLEQWGGPLPQSWIDSHLALGRFILERERSLGMTPILQGFSGCVPLRFRSLFPASAIHPKPVWCEVPPGTAQVDPADPLFERFGRSFLQEQSRLLGTDHYYAADPFHEGEPPESAPAYLHAVGARLFSTLRGFDPKATIVMQGWTIREGIVKGIPADRLLVLDLTGDKWRETNAFWGRPWVAGILHNFGGRTAMGADLPAIASNAPGLLGAPQAGRLCGIGAFPEAIEQNPVVYDLAFDLGWRLRAPDLEDWLRDWVRARYGKDVPAAQAAWRELRTSVYAQREQSPQMETPLCARPSLTLTRASPWGDLARGYPPEKVWQAWGLLLAASGELGRVDTFRYDLVDTARQALADLSLPLFGEVVAAHRRGDRPGLEAAEGRFLELAEDLDALAGTRREFLLGRWLADARRWGADPREQDLCERNARLLLTVWGPPGPRAELFDYAGRQWSGLLRGFYLQRWRRFFAYLEAQPPGFRDDGIARVLDRPADDANAFYRGLSAWEYRWCDAHDAYGTVPAGDSLEAARRLFFKWKPAMQGAYPRFDWANPGFTTKP